MWNFIRRFFRGPALDVIVAVALDRVKEKLAEQNLSESEAAAAQKLLDLFVEELMKEIRD